MATPTWQTILARGQQTVGVWTQFAPAFNVDDLTLALHEADVNALAPLGLIVEQKQDAVDDARTARDATAKAIGDFGVRMARKLDGELSPADPFHRDLEDIRSVAFDSIPGTLSRGQKTVSLWEKYNARRAAATPAKPALTVGGRTLALYKADVEALPGKTLGVEKAESVLRDARGDLRTLAARVDSNNKRWYAAWSGEFAAGSPERMALGQIDTGSPGSDEGGSLPGAPQNVGIITGAVGSGALAFQWDANAAEDGVASYKVYRAAAVLAQVVSPVVSVNLDNFAPGESVTLTVSAVNAAGEGPQSESATGTAG